MAYQSYWYTSSLPADITKIIERELKVKDSEFKESVLLDNKVDSAKRNSKNTWVEDSHWVAGFIWHFVQKANRENFLYDIHNFEDHLLQYTCYGPGEYYNWHVDGGLSIARVPTGNFTSDYLPNASEICRKLSVTLQLSDPNDYEEGVLELETDNGDIYQAPKEQGTIIVFDSRTKHRVTPVKKGNRKSIVGWVTGPRWR